MRLRLGLLSTAAINRAILGGARLTDAVEVVAVASREQERAEAYAAEHGLGRAHGSYDELLADPDVDAVYIPLPNSMHVPWSVRALEAGKHVLAEKPLTRRPEEAEAAFDAAEAAGRVLAEAFMWRHTEQTRRLRELLAEEAVGPLRVIRANFSFDIFGMDRPDDVRLQAGLDGGGLMDVGCYCVSALRLLGGEPVSVSGRQLLGGDGVDIRFAGTMAFPGDVFGVFECGLDMVARHELELVGTTGTIHVGDPWHQRSPRILVRRAGGTDTIDFQPSNAYAAELEDFAAAVRGERAHPFGRADAVAQARTIAALYEAAERGADVEL